MKRLWLDFESRSLVDLKKCGLDNYAKHPSTQVLMLAYAFDMEVPQLWQPRLGPMPAELRAAILDPTIKLCAWNYQFEKHIFEYVLGMPIELSEWYDPSVLAAYMSLPIGLGKAGDALAIMGKKISMAPDEGVKFFSVPKKATKKMLANGSPAQYFEDWNSNPDKWEAFCKYCKQDVIAEREIHYALAAINSPMTEGEIAAWELDQRMNSTGVYIDRPFVSSGKKLAEAEANQLLAQIKGITGLENPNSGAQLKKWLEPRGYPFDSLDVEHIESALTCELTPEVRELLLLKQKLGGSAFKKFAAIQDRISADGRLRDQFCYHGAHTGRWSGRGVQLQNLYKPDKKASKVAEAIIEAIRAETLVSGMFPGIDMMTCIASVIRTSFCAAPGKKLIVGDLAQIESRVLAAMAGCKVMIDAYAKGHDLYLEFMSWLLQKPLTKEDNPDERACGKVVILGSGYGMGPDKFVDYCATFGLTMPLESDDEDEITAYKCIYGFREKYAEIPQYWKALENGCKDAVRFRKCVYVKGMVIDGRNVRVLKIKLPSGRYLHYFNARLEKKKKFDKMQECLCYTAYDSKGVQTKDLYGGLICENVIQAVARDILLSGMLNAEAAGGTVCMTIHDEIVCEVPLDSAFNVDVLSKCMTEVPEWACGMGFVLAAECWEGPFYRK